MSNETQHIPADVRERVAKIVREAMEDARRAERLNTFPQSSMWDYADRILALLRTPRGEGEAKFDVGDPAALRLAASKLEASGYDVLALRLRKIADQIKCVIAARRSKAQGDAEALAAADMERVPTTKGGEMSEGTLQALRDRINARLQTSAISRDRASAAGREVVAQCRQSDVETLEWVRSEIDAVLAALRSEAQAARRGEGGGA